jgi:tRNA modification GTPase
MLDQVNGAFERTIECICQHLQSGNATMARAEIDEVLAFAEMGQHLVKPWRVVIAGAPNVGKSSLINALAGYTRSLVAPTAGTTRDLVTLEVAIGGWCVELIDSAGLREDAAALEREGSALARQAMAAAHLILWVLDASTAPVWPEQIDENRTLFVINKIDLAPAWGIAREGLAKQVSARTGERIAALCEAVSRRLVPNPSPAGRGIPVLNSQVDILQAARRCLDSGSSELALASLRATEKSGQDGKFDQIDKGAW